MSTILQYILDIFTFQLNPIVSVAFYLALLIVPGISFLAARSKSVGGANILSKVMMGLAIVIFVAGGIFFAMIASSGDEFKFGEQVAKQDVSAVLTAPKNGWIYIKDGEFYADQNLQGADATKYLGSHKTATAQFEADKIYDIMEIDARPKAQDLSRAMLTDGSIIMVQNGTYYDEELIETAIGFSLLIVIICFGMMLGYGIFKMVDDPKGAVKPLIIFGGLVAIIGIGYAMEGGVFEPLSDEVIGRMGTSEVTDTDQKDAGGGIIASFVLIGIAAISAIVWSIANLVKLSR